MSVKKYCYCENNCKYETLSKEEIYAAIAQAVETGTIGECDTGFITTIKTINGKPLKFFVGSQSEYDALADKQNLFAIITNDITKDTLLGAITELQTSFDEFSDGVRNGKITVGKATITTDVEATEGTVSSFRHIWFSDNMAETKRAYTDKFKYNPITGVLDVTEITGKAASAKNLEDVPKIETATTNPRKFFITVGGKNSNLYHPPYADRSGIATTADEATLVKPTVSSLTIDCRSNIDSPSRANVELDKGKTYVFNVLCQRSGIAVSATMTMHIPKSDRVELYSKRWYSIASDYVRAYSSVAVIHDTIIRLGYEPSTSTLFVEAFATSTSYSEGQWNTYTTSANGYILDIEYYSMASE